MPSVQKIEKPSELSRRYIEVFVGVKKAITMISNQATLHTYVHCTSFNEYTRENKDMFFENKDAFGDSCHDLSQQGPLPD